MFLNYIVSFDGILSMQAKFFVVVCHKIGNKVFFIKSVIYICKYSDSKILGVIACLLARSVNRGADINFSGLYWSPCVVILIHKFICYS